MTKSRNKSSKTQSSDQKLNIINAKAAAFYRRLYRRAGAAKAITATAHKIARIFYRLWTTKQSYQDLGADYYEQQYRQRVINNLSKKAQSLGFQLVEASSAWVKFLESYQLSVIQMWVFSSLITVHCLLITEKKLPNS